MSTKKTNRESDKTEASPSDPSPASQPPRWKSQDLLQGFRMAVIVHENETYRLFLTKNGKLLLQK
jgi:hemin uptake protein HemP